MTNQKYSYDRLLDNELVYRVFRQIGTSEEGSYPTEIARDLEKGGREEVSRICSRLLEEGFIEKGKRTKAQYYKISASGVSENLFRLIQEDEEELDDLKEFESNQVIQEFISNYVKQYLRSAESSTIREMLTEDLLQGLSIAPLEEIDISQDTHRGLWQLKRYLNASIHDFLEDPSDIVLEAVSELENKKEDEN